MRFKENMDTEFWWTLLVELLGCQAERFERGESRTGNDFWVVFIAGNHGSRGDSLGSDEEKDRRDDLGNAS